MPQYTMRQGGIVLPAWRRISYLELELATDGFCETNLIGKGGFGSVYKGKLHDGKEIAVKVFNLQQEERALRSFDVECQVKSNIRHRNLVKIISSCTNLDFKALILEYMPKGSLEKLLYSHNYCLDILQRLNIMIDVASALHYLHQGFFTPIVHCDLKPSNILLDEDMVAHVSDLGIAKLLGEGDSMTRTRTMFTIGRLLREYNFLVGDSQGRFCDSSQSLLEGGEVLGAVDFSKGAAVDFGKELKFYLLGIKAWRLQVRWELLGVLVGFALGLIPSFTYMFLGASSLFSLDCFGLDVTIVGKVVGSALMQLPCWVFGVKHYWTVGANSEDGRADQVRLGACDVPLGRADAIGKLMGTHSDRIGQRCTGCTRRGREQCTEGVHFGHGQHTDDSHNGETNYGLSVQFLMDNSSSKIVPFGHQLVEEGQVGEPLFSLHMLRQFLLLGGGSFYLHFDGSWRNSAQSSGAFQGGTWVILATRGRVDTSGMACSWGRQVGFLEIADANLLTREQHLYAAKKDFIHAVFALAVDCTVENPEERADITKVVTLLKSIRIEYLANLIAARTGGHSGQNILQLH
ncbi:hypothetical protein Tsubulata_030084 [Turnera subulata]|uniref:non-specific serine/threonine protein kinase n=1 Tax=Turnera subulata TaxID=218843 RepID=A0A9Q0FVL7_9ROSI|nr:hypothetical protein Tsubulata_030084 [Turnera subulata]